MTNLSSKQALRKQQLSYFGHIMRRENGLVAQEREPDHEHKCIAESTLNELYGSVRDQDAWRKNINAITRSRARLRGTRQPGNTTSYTLLKSFKRIQTASLRMDEE